MSARALDAWARQQGENESGIVLDRAEECRKETVPEECQKSVGSQGTWKEPAPTESLATEARPQDFEEDSAMSFKEGVAMCYYGFTAQWAPLRDDNRRFDVTCSVDDDVCNLKLTILEKCIDLPWAAEQAGLDPQQVDASLERQWRLLSDQDPYLSVEHYVRLAGHLWHAYDDEETAYAVHLGGADGKLILTLGAVAQACTSLGAIREFLPLSSSLFFPALEVAMGVYADTPWDDLRRSLDALPRDMQYRFLSLLGHGHLALPWYGQDHISLITPKELQKSCSAWQESEENRIAASELLRAKASTTNPFYLEERQQEHLQDRLNFRVQTEESGELSFSFDYAFFEPQESGAMLMGLHFNGPFTQAANHFERRPRELLELRDALKRKLVSLIVEGGNDPIPNEKHDSAMASSILCVEIQRGSLVFVFVVPGVLSLIAAVWFWPTTWDHIASQHADWKNPWRTIFPLWTSTGWAIGGVAGAPWGPVGVVIGASAGVTIGAIGGAVHSGLVSRAASEHQQQVRELQSDSEGRARAVENHLHELQEELQEEQQEEPPPVPPPEVAVVPGRRLDEEQHRGMGVDEDGGDEGPLDVLDRPRGFETVTTYLSTVHRRLRTHSRNDIRAALWERRSQDLERMGDLAANEREVATGFVILEHFGASLAHEADHIRQAALAQEVSFGSFPAWLRIRRERDESRDPLLSCAEMMFRIGTVLRSTEPSVTDVIDVQGAHRRLAFLIDQLGVFRVIRRMGVPEFYYLGASADAARTSLSRLIQRMVRSRREFARNAVVHRAIEWMAAPANAPRIFLSHTGPATWLALLVKDFIRDARPEARFWSMEDILIGSGSGPPTRGRERFSEQIENGLQWCTTVVGLFDEKCFTAHSVYGSPAEWRRGREYGKRVLILAKVGMLAQLREQPASDVIDTIRHVVGNVQISETLPLSTDAAAANQIRALVNQYIVPQL